MESISPTALYPTAIILPLFSGIAVLLDIAPLIWHCRNRNVSAASLAIWIIVLNSLNVLNAGLWPRNNTKEWWHGAGLCDVEVKLYVGAWIALSGAIASVMRTLANIMDTTNQTMLPSPAQRHWNLAIELTLCGGFPCLIMALSYIVQPWRYYIFGIAGCVPAFDNSWPTFVLVFMWPLILILAAVFYSMLLVIRMRRYRNELNHLLELSSTAKSRFLRLTGMSIFAIVTFLPLETYILYRNATVAPLQPYSWARVHSKEAWSVIPLVPSNGTYVFDRWVYMGCGYAVFVFFGLGAEALNSYRAALARLGLPVRCPSAASSRASNPFSHASSTVTAKTAASVRSWWGTVSYWPAKLARAMRPGRVAAGTAESTRGSRVERSAMAQLGKTSLASSGTLITTTVTSTLSEVDVEGQEEVKSTVFF